MLFVQSESKIQVLDIVNYSLGDLFFENHFYCLNCYGLAI